MFVFLCGGGGRERGRKRGGGERDERMRGKEKGERERGREEEEGTHYALHNQKN
jgi:hypothetical protein